VNGVVTERLEGFRAVAAISRRELAWLVSIFALGIAAVAISASLLARIASSAREVEALRSEIRRAGDVRAKLAEVEARIAECEARLAAAAARTPASFLPAAMEARIEFKARELGLTLAQTSPWTVQQVSFGPHERKWQLKGHERTIDLRGGFREVLALLAATESWEELLVVRTLRVARSSSPGEVVARVQLCAFQAVEGAAP